MQKLLLIVVGVVLALYLAAIFVPFEPDERRPGARLSGSLASDQQTNFADQQGRKQILLETSTWYLIPHSVTTTSWHSNGAFYVPCRACDKKRWPKNVAGNPHVRLKVDGQIYERTAVRITDPDQRRRVLGVATNEPLPDVAVFRMDPRG